MSTLKPPNHDGAGEIAAVLQPEPFESDDDYAFRVQLLEAMAASLTFQPSSPTQSPLNAAVGNACTSQPSLGLEREIFDRNLANQEAKKTQDDLSRWINDHKLAEQLQSEWEGYEIGEASRSVSDEVFSIFCKGILVTDENCVSKAVGIGVAICDERDDLVYEMSKEVKVMEGEWMNNRVVAANALIEGLSCAVDLGLKNVVFFCDYYPLYQMVTRRWSSKQDKMAILISKIDILRKNFTECMPSFVPRNAVKYAYKFAREAIVPQTNKQVESTGTKIESCVICLEDVDVCQIFSVDGCSHRYCFSCMKQHVKVKLLNAILPKCPHDGCPSVLKLDSCQKFLTPKWIDIMSERLTEAAIPVIEKIYCPYPRCSALMSRTGILEYTKSLYPDVHECGVRKCMKCHGLFCVNCKVPWHNNMTCYVFKKNNISQHAEDVKLKTLAAHNRWRQCLKCNHMIELAKGCYHMTCRCGYEFCYTCGSEWKNKKATCTCPLWDDDHIMDNDSDDEEYGEFEDGIGNYDDYDSDSDDFY
ncbi:E3 ubiquitin-protein ligase RSL1-like isoform X1 [Apium graveolens]|uniref:E3 ubiquitin-protein ligase RSL1-like isoform X1 n=1 Tax=Apium graveolens TaxID=4045 RepID=UPI003D796BB5